VFKICSCKRKTKTSTEKRLSELCLKFPKFVGFNPLYQKRLFGKQLTQPWLALAAAADSVSVIKLHGTEIFCRKLKCLNQTYSFNDYVGLKFHQKKNENIDIFLKS